MPLTASLVEQIASLCSNNEALAEKLEIIQNPEHEEYFERHILFDFSVCLYILHPNSYL
jgi:hypothetical protein